MNIAQLFDGFTTQNSIIILSSLGLAYILGVFSMLGYFFALRQKLSQQKAETKSAEDEIESLKSQQLQAQQPLKDLLEEPTSEPVDADVRFELLEKEFNAFRSDFQDSLEFYVHGVEELTESNHDLIKKVKMLELENEQLVKAVWSDDLSFKSFANDLKGDLVPQNGHDAEQEITSISIKDDEAHEAMLNVKNWLNAQKRKNLNQDNLSKIKGISKAIEEKMNEIGIVSYSQLSLLDDALIDDLAKAINYFSGRIKKEDWVGQAYHLGKQQNG